MTFPSPTASIRTVLDRIFIDSDVSRRLLYLSNKFRSAREEYGPSKDEGARYGNDIPCFSRRPAEKARFPALIRSAVGDRAFFMCRARGHEFEIVLLHKTA